jgi:hypothetical protein
MPSTIFISYSHADASLVAPIVALLRVSRALVFRDADTIRPGKDWRNEIERAIADANVVIVFWCRHADSSEEVAREFRAAIAYGKDVLPLVLDGTPLPRELAPYQHIDFRHAFSNGHGFEPPRAAPAATLRAPKRQQIAWLSGTAMALLLAISSTYLRSTWSRPMADGAAGAALRSEAPISLPTTETTRFAAEAPPLRAPVEVPVQGPAPSRPACAGCGEDGAPNTAVSLTPPSPAPTPLPPVPSPTPGLVESAQPLAGAPSTNPNSTSSSTPRPEPINLPLGYIDQPRRLWLLASAAVAAMAGAALLLLAKLFGQCVAFSRRRSGDGKAAASPSLRSDSALPEQIFIAKSVEAELLRRTGLPSS